MQDAAKDCSEYLKRFYNVPETYRDSVTGRILIPFFGLVITGGCLILLHLAFQTLAMESQYSSSAKHGFTIMEFAMYAMLCLVLVSFLGLPFRKFIITGNGIEVRSSFFFRKVIFSDNILGYAINYVQMPRGAKLVFSIVHTALGKKQLRTPLPMNMSDLKEERLCELFRSMQNYGSVPLDDILSKVIKNGRVIKGAVAN